MGWSKHRDGLGNRSPACEGTLASAGVIEGLNHRPWQLQAVNMERRLTALEGSSAKLDPSILAPRPTSSVLVSTSA